MGEAMHRRDQEAELRRATMKQLPTQLDKPIHDIVRDYTKDSFKKVRAVKRLDKNTKVKDKFDNSTAPDYPEGIKPYRMSEAATEFDKPLPRAMTEEVVVTIKIPVKATMRQACTIAHWEFAKFRAECEFEAAKIVNDLADTDVSRETLGNKIMEEEPLRRSSWLLCRDHPQSAPWPERHLQPTAA